MKSSSGWRSAIPKSCSSARSTVPTFATSCSRKIDARRQLGQFLAGHAGETGIVYCPVARKKVESIAESLRKDGYNALPYHAGLPAEVRAEHQHRFLTDDAVIVVATIAFGMGIDRPDVRFVAHLDLPKNIESYYQETAVPVVTASRPRRSWSTACRTSSACGRWSTSPTAGEERKRHDRQKLDALLGWCEVTDCRRRPLLAYFGDEMAGPCGNCDNCLSPPATWDGTVAAQKLLSAVYRTGQRFGAAHVVDVLLGKDTDKVRQHGHARLSVFGIGKEIDASTWRSAVRQLIVQGVLRADPARYGALVLTKDSKPLLKGEVDLRLREDRKLKTAKVRRSDSGQPLSPADEALFESLRARRKEIAERLELPPYVVFHDATLRAMAEHRPRTDADLLSINGVGEAKLERYGEAFLEVIAAA